MSNSPSTGFHYSVSTDPESQWKIHELSYRDARNPSRTVIARIVPAGGSNLISLEVDGTELLRVPPKITEAAGMGFGIPILYPSPSDRIETGRERRRKRSDSSNKILTASSSSGVFAPGSRVSEPGSVGRCDA